jgi:hypothetical protein
MTDYDHAQRVLLGLLLEEHPRMLKIEEVHQRLSDVAGLDDALKILAADGLARRLGDLVGATLAAVRADQLSL